MNTIMHNVVFILLAVSTLSYSYTYEVDKLFVGVTYEYDRYDRKWYDPFKWGAQWVPETTSEEMYTGTYWSIQAPPPYRNYFVTAAHVLHIGTIPTTINGVVVDDSRLRITGRQIRAYMGFLAYDIGYIGTIAGLQDVVFLRPRRDMSECTLTHLQLANRPPVVREEVNIFGFPSTPRQQLETAQVSSVHESQGYFVLNRAVDPGYSGGPVVDSEGYVYGIVANTDHTNRQTNVIRIDSDMLTMIEWSQF